MDLHRRFTLAALCALGLVFVSRLVSAEVYWRDGAGNPVGPQSWTICGQDKMHDMIGEPAKIQALGHPIGFYQINSPDGMDGACSGTLIDTDLFLTARHCAADCSTVSVTFGYLQRGSETFQCKEIVEQGGQNDNEDYLIIRLDGKPGVKWGWYSLSDEALKPGDPLMIIHHPEALPMKISLPQDCTFKAEVDGMLHHRCDTNPGSSGSGILKPDLQHPENIRVVGVHTLGGCEESPDTYNAGPSIRQLAKISPLIRAHLKSAK